MYSKAIRPCIRPLALRRYSVCPVFINGQYIDGESALHFDVVNPRSKQTVGIAQGCSDDLADKAIESSYVSFQTWKHGSPHERRDILLGAVDRLVKTKEEGLELSRTEIDLDPGFASFIYDLGIELFKYCASITTSLDGTIPYSLDKNAIPLVYRQPIGPVLGITPWNAPGVLATRAFLFPIAAGCTSILKTPSAAPASCFHFAKALIESGLPPGVLNVVHGSDTQTPGLINRIIAAPEIRKINYTGSTNIGRKIAVAAAEHVKPVCLELGGKAVSLILEDADLEKAAESVLFGAFLNKGQVCMSTEITLVPRSKIHQFEELLKTMAPLILDTIGFSESGALSSSSHFERFTNLVHSAKSDGARVLFESINSSQLPFVVLSDIPSSTALATDESFGPQLSVLSYDTLEEALKVVNSLEYGLNAAVWSGSTMKAIEVSKEIEAGSVHINGSTVGDMPAVPHGGVKSSGYGRFGGIWGLEEYTVLKSVVLH
ncbi:hypothetical protein CANCADRAFT_21589 [Tortispora caseinolytica NRRL Y-17796]|uniref:Aldehyde dehydrogenase domain-containing protein n=1 Tax=Tortispora caseinolytica NRRL Y-17796 TaxID=767744 RepID=A0A1E4TM75_9ASCO|nr:hypothetical protein CANCADRAFT_21589 [Tortispora caseinolytica NRRL Y-17796]